MSDIEITTEDPIEISIGDVSDPVIVSTSFDETPVLVSFSTPDPVNIGHSEVIKVVKIGVKDRGAKGETGGIYGVSDLPDNQIEIVDNEMYVSPQQWTSNQW